MWNQRDFLAVACIRSEANIPGWGNKDSCCHRSVQQRLGSIHGREWKVKCELLRLGAATCCNPSGPVISAASKLLIKLARMPRTSVRGVSIQHQNNRLPSSISSGSYSLWLGTTKQLRKCTKPRRTQCCPTFCAWNLLGCWQLSHKTWYSQPKECTDSIPRQPADM